MKSLQELAGSGNDDEEAAIGAVVKALRGAVDAKVGLGCSFGEREQAMLAIGNEAQRRLLEEELKSIVDGQGKELMINEELHREHQPGSYEYASLCGCLKISRPTFRQVGIRNGPTVVALDLQAGLVEGATPTMAYRVALGYAKDHSRSVVEDMRASHRTPPSRTKLEAMSKRIGAEVKLHAPRIEAYLRQGERLPEGAVGLSVGLDRTAVPMEEKRTDGQAPKTRRKERTKPYERTPPPPIDVTYHMAYMGTVSITDQDGDILIARRYAASPTEGATAVVRGMMADVRNALRRDSNLTVGVVQDGAPEMWNLIRPALKEQAGVTDWLEAIDRYHLNQRLGKVLKAIEPESSELRKQQLHDWNEELDTDDSTIDRIEQRIAEEMDKHDGDTLAVLQGNATFIENNKDRMRYVLLRKAALPVGSGVTEGACRSVIGERTKRASRRWKEEGLSAVLALRGIYCSDRLSRFFTYFQKRYTANIREADKSEGDAAA